MLNRMFYFSGLNDLVLEPLRKLFFSSPIYVKVRNSESFVVPLFFLDSLARLYLELTCGLFLFSVKLFTVLLNC